MEQRIKEQIDVAIKTLNEKLSKFQEQYEQLESEILTPEICDMAFTIIDKEHYCFYSIPSWNESNRDLHLVFDGTCSNHGRITFRRKYSDATSWIRRPNFLFNENRTNRYSESTLRDLKRDIEYLELFEKEIDALQTYGPLWVEDITERYKNITEAQTNALNEIFAGLGREDKPIKHIKVTVEWI